MRWFPYQKGGPFRKYAGNIEHVVDWENDGFRLRNTRDENGKVPAHAFNEGYIFKHNVNWSAVSSGNFSCRITELGCLFDASGSAAFPIDEEKIFILSAFLNSPIAREMIGAINPTLNFQAWEIGNLPILEMELSPHAEGIVDRTKKLRSIAQRDWDAYETSLRFNVNPLISNACGKIRLEETYIDLKKLWLSQTDLMKNLEHENNHILIEVYGLQDELTPDVPLSEITLTCNPHYRYGGDLTDEEREAKLKSDTMRELVSYAVGCMMGRYSLAEPGLIYAHAGGVGFDPSRYGPFPADDDGIIPMTEEQWFADDAATRIEEFLGVAWPDAPIMETMTTLMDGLTMGKAGEPRAALRSYLSKQFYKDHLQTYKNRPIYWLFSSGRQKAFEALVYLHRYNEGTLARMRTVYVTPLMGKLQQRISDLDAEIAASSSSAEKTRKTREKDKLAKQVVELREFDEELRHLADQRIPLDLDDGVKVNYARFGNLLAAKDKVCPKKKGEDE